MAIASTGRDAATLVDRSPRLRLGIVDQSERNGDIDSRLSTGYAAEVMDRLNRTDRVTSFDYFDQIACTDELGPVMESWILKAQGVGNFYRRARRAVNEFERARRTNSRSTR